ncbi:putative competence-damage inducible protein [Novipirellula galeiformis]|uniref:Putative competence-damage inducible protein n=1 Tax=Novipirellula galeiformis TaxID=2528004 RepID=A0A5C6CGY9_9BACT|nr:putative competence-damage inducible protein [Novipirellula galeiformis]
MKLSAEVISIGDEMTSGARLDTNSQWLSQRLGELGVEVRFQTTVGDMLRDNIDVFNIAIERVDLVICTGGLGPTQDDLTREALAEVSDEPLEFRQQAMDHIESLFSSRKRPMPERNRVQAMFPKSSQIIPNPQGTAPGIDLFIDRGSHARCRVFALPGVPAEMQLMFKETVSHQIAAMSGGGSVIRHHVMKFFGIGESDMEQRLGDMISRDRQPRVGITVSAATISLRITAMTESAERCTAQIAQTKTEILNRVGELYFGDGENYEQYHVIDSMLRARGESLALLELGFAAPLGDWFAALGETPAFRGGLSLAAMPNVSLEEIQSRMRSDWLLVVNAYPAIADDLVGHVPASEVEFILVAPNGKQHAHRITIGGHPDILQPRIGKTAMAWFRGVVAGLRTA